MTELEYLCFKIAYKYHAGQVDKAGIAYIYHPEAVADKVNKEIEKCVAWLHDTLEDTELTAQDLLELDVPQIIVDYVEVMTHKQGESYDDYIKRVAEHEVTRNVKIADLEHNMDLSRIPNPTQRDFDRVENKYKKYYKFLKNFSKNY